MGATFVGANALGHPTALMVEGPKGGNIKKMTNPVKNIALTALGMKEGGEGGGVGSIFYSLNYQILDLGHG